MKEGSEGSEGSEGRKEGRKGGRKEGRKECVFCEAPVLTEMHASVHRLL